jgi:transaldolase
MGGGEQMMTKLHKLVELGQSIWLDYISRSLITSGELEDLIDQGLRGVTSNPSIFEKAIDESSDYDDELRELAIQGKSADEIYESLVTDDVRDAVDLMRRVYDATEGLDGYVSLEVNPKLAHDTDRTITEAQHLYAALDRPNVLIKVPATPAGVPAIEALIGEGINVNVTLIFSLTQYEAIANAYIAGLEKLAEGGGDVTKVASVASFFVSRIDTAVDQALEKAGNTELQGKIAIASARTAYARFREIFKGPRWERLSASGARVQRPLWASTSTKNPAYPDILYVDNLIGPDTVNTLPMATMKAFLDHGHVRSTIEADLDEARAQIAGLADAGVSLDNITQKLQDDGVDAFARSFEILVNSISEKRQKFLDER